jgi:hypothetical protein
MDPMKPLEKLGMIFFHDPADVHPFDAFFEQDCHEWRIRFFDEGPQIVHLCKPDDGVIRRLMKDYRCSVCKVKAPEKYRKKFYPFLVQSRVTI